MSDIPRIEENVRTMIGKGAPEVDIDAYLKIEGHTPDTFKKAVTTGEPGMLSRAASTVAGAVAPAKDALDFAQTAGTRVISNFLGAPADLGNLLDKGVGWAAEKVLGPRPQIPGGDYKGVMPGSADIKQVINTVREATGGKERSLADVKALQLTQPFGLGGNVNVGSLLDSGVDFAGSMLAGPGSAGRNLALGAVSGVGSDALGQATKGTKWETPARIFGAGLGGVAGIGAGKLANKAESILAPWTQGGKERIASDIIGGVATNPRQAISALDKYTGDAVPGVTQTPAKITADPGLLSLENYAYGTAGNNAQLQSMVTANNTARTAHLAGLEAGDIGNFVSRVRQVDQGLARDVDSALAALPPSATPTQAGQAIQDALTARQAALTADRRTVTQPIYDEVSSWRLPVNASGARLEGQRQIGTTKGELQGTARTADRALYTAEGLPDNTAQGLVAARQSMSNTLSREATTPAEARIIQSILRQTDNALEDAVPAARTARQEYARMSEPLAPFSRQEGPSVFRAINENRPMDPAVVPQMFMQPGQQGVAGIRQLQATGAPAALEPLPGYVADMVRQQPQNAGRVATNFGPALDQLDPALRPRVAAVQGTQDARTGFQATPAGRMATGTDPAKELGTVLSAKDGRTQIADMVLRANGDEAALKGVRQGILDDFKMAIESRGGTQAGGEATLVSSNAKRWVDQKLQNARGALTPEQEKGIRALADSLDVQSRTAPKMAGSDTVRNAMSGTFMGKMLEGGVSKVPGMTTLLRTAQTKEDIVRIVAESLADPQAAKVMLMRYSAGNAKMAEPIFRRLAEQQKLLAPQEVGGNR